MQQFFSRKCACPTCHQHAYTQCLQQYTIRELWDSRKKNKKFLSSADNPSKRFLLRVNYFPTHFAALHVPHIVAPRFALHLCVLCSYVVNAKYFAYFSEFTIGFSIPSDLRTNSYLFFLRP